VNPAVAAVRPEHSTPAYPGRVSRELTDVPAPPGRPGPAPHEPLRPRTAVLLVSLFGAVLLIAVVALLPVPYAVLSQGPALNTLSSAGGKPLIEISGHPTYPATGGLYLTTVSVLGGPRPVTLPTVLRAWLDPAEQAVPVEDIYPPNQTAQQTDQESRQEMTNSQTSATAAALAELGIPVTLSVASVAKDAPAAAVLRSGDVLLAVQGHEVTSYASLRSMITPLAPAAPVSVRVRRGGTDRTVDTTTTKDNAGRTILGVVTDIRFPFTVKIQLTNVVGPSAGLMFALGIVDKLTPGDLTGGRQIAGTGEIGSDGTVSPIGGIGEKMMGARHVGATWFLAPADNCDEVVGRVPAGLRVVKVSTLHGAREAVEAIASGGSAAAALPSCS
jgi:Lon-like protease